MRKFNVFASCNASSIMFCTLPKNSSGLNEYGYPIGSSPNDIYLGCYEAKDGYAAIKMAKVAYGVCK